ncbi:Aste57867_12489 [Aphanomyces stellatus]|uniref:Aste57867_12489 protein n=1 Tax=Aphanomyces stellatus TaxID=120398 RepID=A0A485KW32_9STRA|nr:hypothetical protein As57867_012443 [Aphanomyces stellatus]VFT89340.1 Aste57867_12489 [Aphanomyces stellatus]
MTSKHSAFLPPLAPKMLKRAHTDLLPSMDDISSLLMTTKLEMSKSIVENVLPRDRDSVQAKLIAVLIASKPNTPMHMRQQLPSLAKKLEAILLRVAKSKAEYMDPATIMGRLQAVHGARQAKRRRTSVE